MSWIPFRAVTSESSVLSCTSFLPTRFPGIYFRAPSQSGCWQSQHNIICRWMCDVAGESESPGLALSVMEGPWEEPVCLRQSENCSKHCARHERRSVLEWWKVTSVTKSFAHLNAIIVYFKLLVCFENKENQLHANTTLLKAKHHKKVLNATTKIFASLEIMGDQCEAPHGPHGEPTYLFVK